jgi:hypothetical protein
LHVWGSNDEFFDLGSIGDSKEMKTILDLIDKYVPVVAKNYGIFWGVVVAIIIIVSVYLLYSAGWS